MRLCLIRHRLIIFYKYIEHIIYYKIPNTLSPVFYESGFFYAFMCGFMTVFRKGGFCLYSFLK